ncbi:MAG: hypothetical protein RLZ44_863 [Pseudomonadota bacterium]|jgi:peptidyl-prolyl cis-trans isomerase C
MSKLVPAAALAMLALSVAAEDAPTPTPRTLVTVNDKPLTELHYALFRNQRGAEGGGSPQEQIALLNQLVNTAMLAAAARTEGLDQHPEVVAALEVADMRVLAEVALRNYLNTHPISDEQLQQAYQARYVDVPTTEYKARHILVETKEKAVELIQQLDGGADFAELAKTNSTGPSGPKGGDLGWFEAGQMVKPFSDALVQLNKGQYTKEPVQTRFGWHIILLEDQRTQPTPDLADVRQDLLTELQRESVTAYMAEVRDKTKIEIQTPPAEKAAE